MSIRRHKIIYSLINNTEDVVNDTTREEVPLQSISLEHNIIYDELNHPMNNNSKNKNIVIVSVLNYSFVIKCTILT